MFLDAPQQIERGARAGAVFLGLQAQAQAQDAGEDEREEADQGMGPDAVRQAMGDQRDLNVALETPEATLDVGEALGAGDRLGRGDVGRIGQQGQLAGEPLGPG